MWNDQCPMNDQCRYSLITRSFGHWSLGFGHSELRPQREVRSSDFFALFNDSLAADQVVERLPLANQMRLAVDDQNFRRQWLRVVIRGHDKAIGSSAFDYEIIANRGHRKRTLTYHATRLLCENIT